MNNIIIANAHLRDASVDITKVKLVELVQPVVYPENTKVGSGICSLKLHCTAVIIHTQPLIAKNSRPKCGFGGHQSSPPPCQKLCENSKIRVQ